MALLSLSTWVIAEVLMGGGHLLFLISCRELRGKTVCGETHSLSHVCEAQDMSSCVMCSLGRGRHELM